MRYDLSLAVNHHSRPQISATTNGPMYVNKAWILQNCFQGLQAILGQLAFENLRGLPLNLCAAFRRVLTPVLSMKGAILVYEQARFFESIRRVPGEVQALEQPGAGCCRR